ncbi:MAG: DUF1559 family PulG-like putative transporter [Armatimonadota bacterium]
MFHRKLAQQHAFTLIELLVVASIVTVLASILYPVIARARERANASRCIANQKQIGAAMVAYVGDWDDTYPSGWIGPADARYGWSWKVALLPYLGGTELLRCPSNPVGAKEFDQPSGRGMTLSISYAPNRSAIPRWSLDGDGVTQVDSVQNPAETIMVIENRSRWPDQGIWAVDQHGDAIFPPDGYSQPDTMGPFNSHAGLVNIVFMDGHAQPLKLSTTLVPREMWKDYLRDPDTPYNQEWCAQAVRRLAIEYR